MATFVYYLEYLKDDNSTQDPSVYIHMKQNVPVYQNMIDKEAYENGASTSRTPWMDGIFNIGGIVEASSRAYRVWVSVSPIYTWDEVLPPLLYFMMNYLGDSDMYELPQSGITLNAVQDRRAK